MVSKGEFREGRLEYAERAGSFALACNRNNLATALPSAQQPAEPPAQSTATSETSSEPSLPISD